MSEAGAMIGTPVGPMYVLAREDGAITHCAFGQLPSGMAIDEARCGRVLDQLDQYFAGTREAFDLDLAPAGTLFQRSVWDALMTIPYGRTVSYRWLAETVGRPKAVRAVGQANGANPLAVIVPCHRVIGSSGKLVGYGGGMDAKEILLALERRGRSGVEERNGLLPFA